MSTTELGTINATRSVERTAGWIFALVLAVLFAVSLIATTGPGQTVERAPAPAFSVGDQLAADRTRCAESDPKAMQRRGTRSW